MKEKLKIRFSALKARHKNNRRWSEAEPAESRIMRLSAPEGLNKNASLGMNFFTMPFVCFAPPGRMGREGRFPPVPCEYALHRRLFMSHASGVECSCK
jgi:hypothetical protein